MNNPVKYRDPSGHAACIDEECDLRSNPLNDDVIVAEASNPVYRLILEVSQGYTTASNALERVLSQTSGTGLAPEGIVDTIAGALSRTHFRGLGASQGDKGFRPEMGDDYLYGTLWGERLPYSQQLGHFLTAVDMGRTGDRNFERLVIGHEEVGDQFGAIAQARAPSDADFTAFEMAIGFDLAGDYEGRDAELYSIFNPAVHGPQVDRRGNSMEDLRLSVRGWELGHIVATQGISTNRALANWLALNVAGH